MKLYEVSQVALGYCHVLVKEEYYSYIESDIGTLKADGSGKIVVEFILKCAESVRFRGLPVGSTYKITEKASSYASSYTVTDLAEKDSIVKASDTNGTETKKALSTSTEVVDLDEEVVIIFTNTKLNHDIKISKLLDMTYCEDDEIEYRNLKFRFKVDFSNLIPDKKYTLSYTSSYMTGEVNSSFTATKATDSLEVELKHGDTVTIRDLEEGVTYKVTELYDKNAPLARYFLPSYVINSNDGATVVSDNGSVLTPGELSTETETVDENDLVVNILFTNRYEFTPYVLPATGFEDQRTVMVIAIAGMSIFAVIFTVSRRRRRKEYTE